MSALTCIRNPNDQTQTLVFFTTPDLQLGYQARDEDDLDRKATSGKSGLISTPSSRLHRGAPADEKPVTGLIKHPGALQALYFQKLLRVYGITTSGLICEVSPGVHNFENTISTKNGGLSGCGDNKDAGWLYYLSSGETPTLKQYVLATGANVTMQGPPTPRADSALSAYYKEPQASGQWRGCVYQDKDTNKLKYWEISSQNQQSTGQIDNSSQAAGTTPIATCVKGDTVYLYFVNGDSALVRAQRTGQGAWGNEITDSTNEWNLNPLWATLSLKGDYIVVRQQYETSSGYFEYPDSRQIS